MSDVTVAASIFYNLFVYLQISVKLKIILIIPAVDTFGVSVAEQVIDQSEDWCVDPLLLQFECKHFPLARYELRVASDAFIEE